MKFDKNLTLGAKMDLLLSTVPDAKELNKLKDLLLEKERYVEDVPSISAKRA